MFLLQDIASSDVILAGTIFGTVSVVCLVGGSVHRQPKLAVCVLGDFIDSLNISLSLKNEQVEMKTQMKKRVNKTLLTFYLLLLDVY